jgi:cytosine/adenosine deaminase-related metal-dependent hydrolase
MQDKLRSSRVTGRVLDVAEGVIQARRATINFEDGRITGIGDADATVGNSPADDSNLLLMPPLVNAHDHVRGVRPIALGGFDLPLELWVLNMSGTPKIDPYVVAAAALGRQALSGVGAMSVHYTRPQDASRLGEELASVRRAAADIGVRLGIAVGMRDRNPLGYASTDKVLSLLDAEDSRTVRERFVRPSQPPREQVALVEELAAQLEDDSVNVQFGPVGVEWCSRDLSVNVQFGPVGVEWCSRDLLEAVA